MFFLVFLCFVSVSVVVIVAKNDFCILCLFCFYFNLFLLWNLIIEQLLNYHTNHENWNYTNTICILEGRLYYKIGLLFKYGAVINDSGCESNLMQCIRLYNDVNLPYDNPKTNQLFQDPSYVKNKADELIYIFENYLFNNLNTKKFKMKLHKNK